MEPIAIWELGGLVFVIFKGVVEILGGWPEGCINRDAGDGDKRNPNRNAKNCCRL